MQAETLSDRLRAVLRVEPPTSSLSSSPSASASSSNTSLSSAGDGSRRERLALDAKTPDKWIERDSRLIRLTGAHPLNCEPPLTLLYDYGFLTPPSLHFVRNHGAVAAISDAEAADWRVSIEGLVDRPLSLSLRELQEQYEAVALPVTLTCAGNRRKEQNMARKSKGFNWGAGGTSTAFWTGALLCDVLRTARPQRGARFVEFEGAEDLPNGKYATGVPLRWALDFERGIMLAWKQNGEDLAPDHGRPLRVVIPGIIGGRSVKWLRRIIVSDQPPQGWYHKYDNRVLPTTVTPEISATSDEWWSDERYAIYNLNLQSVIVLPEHNSILSKSKAERGSSAEADASPHADTFTIKGFAYNGGGIQVSRVEVSLDAGKSWTQAAIRFPEEELRAMNERGELTELYGGKVDLADRMLAFCWCFWEVALPTAAVVAAEDVVVRAMDLNMVAQPRDMYWSVLGMLGNWWYRVAVVDEGEHVRFRHPTSLHASDGWMDVMKAEGRDPTQWFERLSTTLTANEKQAIEAASATPDAIKMVQDEKLGVAVTAAELASHENWFVINGQVYDGTNYLEDHPGGPDSITMVSGEDATEDFMAIHSENAKRMLAKYHVGYLATPLPADSAQEESASATTSTTPSTPAPTFLDPKKWKKTKLISRTLVSQDTRRFEFELESPEQTSGLKVGTHVFVRLRDHNDELVMRAYTPLSCHRTRGRLTLLLKVYFPRDGIPGGRMGLAFEQLKPGDEVEVKGPTGAYSYLGRGQMLHRGEQLAAKKLYMISGGSGITPCYQIMKELAFDADDPTSCHLLFGNREHADIMCYDELEQFKAQANGRILVDYYLSRPTPDVELPGLVYKNGRIDHAVITNSIQTELLHNDAMLMVCGPDGMVESVKSWAELNGVPKNRLVVF